MAISRPGTGLPSTANSTAPSAPASAGRATWSISRERLSTQSVVRPLPGVGKHPAMHTSAMPNAGNAAVGSRPNREPASRKRRNVSASTGSAPFSRMLRRERSKRLVRALERPCGQRIGEVRSGGGGPAALRQPTHPSDGSGQEILRGALHQIGAERHRDREEADQAHVVVEREPRDDHVVVDEVGRRPCSIEVVTDVAVQQHHALRLGRRTRGELQHGDRVRVVGGTPVVGGGRRPLRRTDRPAATNGGSPGTGSTKAANSESMRTIAASDRRIRLRVWSMNCSSAPIRMGSGIVTNAAPVSQIGLDGW